MQKSGRNGNRALYIIMIVLIIMMIPLVSARYVSIDKAFFNTVSAIGSSVDANILANQTMDTIGLIVVFYIVVFSSLSNLQKDTEEEGKKESIFANVWGRGIIAAIAALVFSKIVPVEARRILLVFFGVLFVVDYIFKNFGFYDRLKAKYQERMQQLENGVDGTKLGKNKFMGFMIKILIKVLIWLIIIYLLYFALTSIGSKIPGINAIPILSRTMNPIELVSALVGRNTADLSSNPLSYVNMGLSGIKNILNSGEVKIMFNTKISVLRDSASTEEEKIEAFKEAYALVNAYQNTPGYSEEIRKNLISKLEAYPQYAKYIQ